MSDPHRAEALATLFGLGTQPEAVRRLVLTTYTLTMPDGQRVEGSASLPNGVQLYVAALGEPAANTALQGLNAQAAGWQSKQVRAEDLLRAVLERSTGLDGMVLHTGPGPDGRPSDALLSFRDLHGLYRGHAPVRRRLTVGRGRHLVVALEQNAGTYVPWKVVPATGGAAQDLMHVGDAPAQWQATGTLPRGEVTVVVTVDPTAVPDIDPVAAADRGWGLWDKARRSGNKDTLTLAHVFLQAAVQAFRARPDGMNRGDMSTVESAMRMRTRPEDYRLPSLMKRLSTVEAAMAEG